MSPLLLRKLGLQDYESTWQAMQSFTEKRGTETADELWLVEHPRIFTLGRNGSREHLLSPGDIPVIHTDRGGQVTYHGPGQLVLYTLIDLRRLGIGPRALVNALEQAVIGLLAEHGIEAGSRAAAPGVYVGSDKVASLGLRVRRHGSYHGLSVNVDMDLTPFARINPCGYEGMGVTDLRRLGIALSPEQVGEQLAQKLGLSLGLELLAE